MAEIIVSATPGTTLTDIAPSVLVTLLSSSYKPVGLQAWLKPASASVANLGITLNDYTVNRSYGTWSYGYSSWSLAAGATDSQGYKLITLYAKSPSGIPTTTGDSIGFTLMSSVAGQWSLKSAPFTTGRTVQGLALPAPEPGGLAFGLLGAVTTLFVAFWRKKCSTPFSRRSSPA